MGEAVKPIIKDLRNFAGPVAKAYELNNEAVSVIIGPTGGGKTESSVRRILRIARSQHPSPKDGIRKCRIVCVGNTYRDLWDKAIPSYLKVFSKKYGEWQGGRGDPASHAMDFNWVEIGPDGQQIVMPLHIEVWFRAKAGDQSIEDFVRGLETTCWWFQEMDQLDESVPSLAANRCGRYPEPEDRWDPNNPDHARIMKDWPEAFAGVWGDTNMPVVDSWLYNAAFVEKRYGRGLFVQPPALLDDGTTNPKAENLMNLRRIKPDYYGWLKSTMQSYDINRLLMLKKSFDRRGQPVYPSYSADKHEAEVIEVDGRAPLIIGCDTGNTLKSAALFCQPSRTGYLKVLDEVSPRERQMTLETFAEEIVQKVRLRFSHIRDIILVVDPAARAQMTAGSGQNVTITYAQHLMHLTGLDTELADTNDPGMRRTALGHYLRLDGGLYVDRAHCPDLCAALAGGFAFRKIGNAVSPEVLKNDYSHLGEGLEYAALKLHGASIYFGADGGGDRDAANYDGRRYQPQDQQADIAGY